MYNLNEISRAIKGVILNKDNIKVSSKIRSFSINSKKIENNALFFALKGKYRDGHDFIDEAVANGAKFVVIDKEKKGQNLKPDIIYIFVNDTLIALQKAAKYLRDKNNQALYFGITGSNGKTTTKEMLFSILDAKKNVLKSEVNQNNYIGLPVTLLKTCKEHEIVLLEMGTNMPGEIKLLGDIACPDYGIITNIGESHLEGLQDINGVLKEKFELAKGINKKGIVFLNADDENLMSCADKIQTKIVTYGIKNDADYKASNIKIDLFKSSYCLNDRIAVNLSISGLHNVYNSLAAIAAADCIINDLEFCAFQISKFVSVNARFEVKDINGIYLIDDTYNANPLSFSMAIDFLAQNRNNFKRLIMFVGDMLELGNESERYHFELGRKLREIFPEKLFVIGKYREQVLKGLGNKGCDVICTEDVEKLLKNMDLLCEKGDLIFLKASRTVQMGKIVEKIKEVLV